MLGQNVNSYRDPSENKSFAELLTAIGEIRGHPPRTLSPPRIREISAATSSRPSIPFPRSAITCICRCRAVRAACWRACPANIRREQYLERIALIKAAKNRQISITTDVIVGFPGETEAEFEETLSLLDEVGYDGIFSFKYSARPNTPALKYADGIPDEEKWRRLQA